MGASARVAVFPGAGKPLGHRQSCGGAKGKVSCGRAQAPLADPASLTEHDPKEDISTSPREDISKSVRHRFPRRFPLTGNRDQRTGSSHSGWWPRRVGRGRVACAMEGRGGVTGATGASRVGRGEPDGEALAESLPPSTRKVLAATGLLGVVEAGGFQPNGGNTALWGGEGRRDDFAGGATGFHVLRSPRSR